MGVGGVPSRKQVEYAVGCTLEHAVCEARRHAVAALALGEHDADAAELHAKAAGDWARLAIALGQYE